jgi:hypothetical protein
MDVIYWQFWVLNLSDEKSHDNKVTRRKYLKYAGGTVVWQTGHKMSILQWQDGKPVCVYPDKAPLRYPMTKRSTL